MEPLDAVDEAAKAIAGAGSGDLQFFALSFALACAAGIVRTHRDHRYRDFANLLSTGLTSGFIGVGCVALLCWISGGRAGHEPGLVAAAVFVGLMGKEADKVYPKLIEWTLKRLGIELEEPKVIEKDNPSLPPVPRTKPREPHNGRPPHDKV